MTLSAEQEAVIEDTVYVVASHLNDITALAQRLTL